MTLFASFLLLGVISCSLASNNRIVTRSSIALIPSVSPTLPVVPSATAQALSKKHSKHVNDFFKLYGWLEPGKSVPDSDLPKAIRKIQKVLKEPVTGVFSDKMMDMLDKPRCGTEQPYNETDAKNPSDIHKRYVLWGSKCAAFAQWMRFMPLNIVPANTNANADINILFTSFGRDDTRYAFTSMVSDGVSLAAGNINVTFNDDYQWNDDRLFNFTAIHEIGHAFGMSHSAVEAAVMFAYYEGNIRPIHPDDKMGIHSVYGWKNPKWSRIDSNTAANMIPVTSISNSVSANDGLYQIRSSGQILRYASGTWTSVDNNKDTAQIAGAGGYLYQRHSDGSTYRWSGSNSNWQYIGTASDNVIDIVAASDQVYSRRKDGWVARWSGTGTSWLSIEQPSAQTSKQIAITDSKTLWNLLTTGDLVRSIWPYNSGEWLIVDQNAANMAIAAGGDEFYKLQSDGTVVWLNTKENYWQTIESAGSVAIHAQGDYLYSRHRDGSVWRYTGTSGVWEMLDDRKDVVSVVGDRGGEVWEMLTNGDIYRLVS
ncbi:hypothetical protein N0V83_004234 [Neocucurbitaria cava]|uniref:Peptidase metallopeptidase domain-containing protein n=1 Tax=Neocucurbitaria cava TaxID=798079 RepID=A0A9W9CP23_9PLEO|nr:hypothetical protein N0V83_004234 [Neocucurbitaria cava]